jgi:hypothetical protein
MKKRVISEKDYIKAVRRASRDWFGQADQWRVCYRHTRHKKFPAIENFN